MLIRAIINFLGGLFFGTLICLLVGMTPNIGLVIGAAIGTSIYCALYKEPQT